jgi:DNA polymerase-3 subunit alpha
MLDGEQSGVSGGVGLEIKEAECAEFDEEQRLEFEKEALGFFLSGHPLLRFREELKRLGLVGLRECSELAGGSQVKTALLVTAVKEHMTKKGGRMAFCQVEDLTGTGELTMFPETYARVRSGLDLEQPLLVSAKISSYESGVKGEESGKVKLVAQEVSLLSEQAGNGDQPVCLEVDPSDLLGEKAQALKQIIARYPGPAPIQLTVCLERANCVLRLGPRYRVGAGPDFWRELSQWLKQFPKGP